MIPIWQVSLAAVQLFPHAKKKGYQFPETHIHDHKFCRWQAVGITSTHHVYLLWECKGFCSICIDPDDVLLWSMFENHLHSLFSARFECVDLTLARHGQSQTKGSDPIGVGRLVCAVVCWRNEKTWLDGSTLFFWGCVQVTPGTPSHRSAESVCARWIVDRNKQTIRGIRCDIVARSCSRNHSKGEACAKKTQWLLQPRAVRGIRFRDITAKRYESCVGRIERKQYMLHACHEPLSRRSFAKIGFNYAISNNTI